MMFALEERKGRPKSLKMNKEKEERAN